MRNNGMRVCSMKQTSVEINSITRKVLFRAYIYRYTSVFTCAIVELDPGEFNSKSRKEKEGGGTRGMKEEKGEEAGEA
ncbi:hypothetical protein M0804_009842 [Polistes exclamans]|nr:hypothetical protein M0804_009842 [Polistes exclamans]